MNNYFFCVAGCGTRSLSRRVPCPLLEVVLEAKNRPPQKNINIFLKVYSFNFKLKYYQYFPFWATSMHFVACS